YDMPRGILNLLHQAGAGGLARAKGNIGHDDGALQRIGFAHDSGFRDRRVMQNCAFDLEWSDAVSGALDDIVGAALEPEVAGLVASREIACGDPSVPKKRTCTLRVSPIAQRAVALPAPALPQMA